jgi:hypothetical protein
VDHTSVRAVEIGERWPRNPDAWAYAYGDLAGRSVYDVWAEAMAQWATESNDPAAIAKFSTRLRPLSR